MPPSPQKSARKSLGALKEFPAWLLLIHGRAASAGVLVLGLLGAVGLLAYLLFVEPTVPVIEGSGRRIELREAAVVEVESWLDQIRRRRESGFEVPRASIFDSL